MPDVQFDDVADGRNGLHIVIVEAVTGMHLDPEARRQPGARVQAFQLRRLVRPRALRVSTRMQLNDGRADLGGGLDLPRLRVNKEADSHAMPRQSPGGLGESR